jgi:hypothetical protein
MEWRIIAILLIIAAYAEFDTRRILASLGKIERKLDAIADKK